MLWSVVGGLALTVALVALVARDPPLLAVVPVAMISLVTPAALALRDAARVVRRRTPGVLALAVVWVGVVATVWLHPGTAGDRATHAVVLAANGVALVVVLGTLHLVSGRVLRESASAEGLRGAGDRGGAAMGDEPR